MPLVTIDNDTVDDILMEGDAMYLKAFEQQTMPYVEILLLTCWPANESNQFSTDGQIKKRNAH